MFPDFDLPNGAQRLLQFHGTLSIAWLVSLAALVWLATVLGQRRLDRSALAVGGSPLWSWLIGAAVLLVTVAAVLLLVRHGIRPMRGLLVVTIIAEIALGLAACARWIGQRVLPERETWMQNLLGVASVVLPLAAPIGLPVLLVAVPLGLGAWIKPAR